MKIVIGGDVCITKDAWDIYTQKGCEGLFTREVTNFFSEADASIVNIECPITECNTAILKSGPNLKTKKESINIVRDLGITHASLANNHILDFGISGLDDTISALKRQNIKLIGISDDGPYFQVIEQDGCRLGIISFADDEFNGQMTPKGRVNIYDPLDSFDQIKQLKENCDYVIVLYHSGLENYEYPSPLLQRICRKMVSSGADFVTCQHSHCIGAFEKFENSYILYGQGNFCFYRQCNQSDKWNHAILVQLNFTADHKFDPIFQFTVVKDGCIHLEGENSSAVQQFYERSKQCLSQQNVVSFFEDYCEKNKKASELYCLRGYSVWRYRFDRLTGARYMHIGLPKKKSIVMSNVLRSTVHNEVLRSLLKKMNYGEKDSNI